MKKLLIATLFTIGAGTFAPTLIYAQDEVHESIAIGTAIPKGTAELRTANMPKNVTLQGEKGRNGLLVVFSCNTCPYVIKMLDRTKSVIEYARKNNIGVVVINSNEAQRDDADSYEAMKAFASKNYNNSKVAYAVDNGTEVADAFGASRTPEFFLFDKNEKLAYKGTIDNNPQDATKVTEQFLKNAIDAQVKGKAIAVSSTKSIGCSIKRKS